MQPVPDAAALPVRTLREHATALEAAITVCLAKPKESAVHKVRTETRRIEAQLELLDLLKGFPPYRPEARKLQRQLKKRRRAAGQVRDLDIAGKLIKDEAEKTASEKATNAHDAEHSLRRFRKQCRKVRRRGARKLLKLLTKRQTKISAALEALLKVLQPAEARKLTAAELLALLERHFGATHALMIRNPSTEHLHSIRKAAKLARYMAENAPDSAAAVRTAQRFEAVQEAGGEWHDWLQLADAAAAELGEDDATAAAFAATRDHRLLAYRKLLDTVR